MQTAKERYEHFFKTLLTPFLKERGFKRKSNKFIKYGDELAYVFYVTRGRFDNHDHVEFGIDIDLHVKNFEEKGNPTVYKKRVVAFGLWKLASEKRPYDGPWKTGDADPDRITQETADYYLRAIDQVGIPLMNQFHTIRDVIHALETTPPEDAKWSHPFRTIVPNQIAELYWVLGEKEKALEVLDQKIANAKTRLEREGGQKLKDRILKGGPVYTQP